MNMLELQRHLQKLTNMDISQAILAKAMGISPQSLSARIKNPKSEVTVSELKAAEDFFSVYTNVDVKGICKIIDMHGANSNKSKAILNDEEDCITIEYIGISPECGVGTMVIDEPEIKPIKLSNSLITHYLKCSHPENLKVFKASGDSMETLIEDGDLLLVDIGRKDLYNSGIYVFSVDYNWRVKRFNQKLDGTIEIISDNEKYEIEKIKPPYNLDLQIRGKVIKNLSRGL